MTIIIDIAILLACLAAFAIALRLMLRQLTRPKLQRVAPSDVQKKTPAPTIAASEVPLPVATPKPKRKRPQSGATKSTKSTTPIDRVLDLLKDPNSLATAFLLREILDPPVSRRQR